MASKRSPSDPSGPSARQPRKPQTIELEPGEFASGSSSAAPADTPPPGDSTASSRREGIAWLPTGTSWPIVGAGLLGATGILLSLALFWFTGAIGGSGSSADRIAGIEAQLRELAARPANGRNDTRAVDELTRRLARLETAASAPQSAQSPLSDAALANRLASAENATKAFADNIGSLNSRTDDLSVAVRVLRNRMDATPPVDKSELEALNSRIAALEKSAGAMESELGKRATLASDRAIRHALATAALRGAVERGEPFTAELAAARPLAGENALASLEPFAASGVPGSASLARELSALVPALRRAVETMPAEGGFFDRLKSNAARLVRVRPADEAPGDDPAAIISRIDAKATNLDVAGALVDLAKLPVSVRAPAQAWIDKAQGRIAAIEKSRQIAADAIGALGKASP